MSASPRLPVPSPTVVAKRLESGAVLYCTRSELSFGVNQVGLDIWKGLPPRFRSLDELLAALRRSYPEVSELVLRSDLREFLGELEEAGLVQVPAAAVAPRSGSNGSSPLRRLG